MSHLNLYIFYILAFLSVASALLVVTNQKPTYAVLSLTVTMMALSGLFISLEAYFVAIIQILIYAGAILVLFLFVIMLLGVDVLEKIKKNKNLWAVIGGLAVFIFSGELLLAFALERSKLFLSTISSTSSHTPGTIEAVGEALFSQYLLPFELVSAILLIGIFGVVNLARKER